MNCICLKIIMKEGIVMLANENAKTIRATSL